MITNADCHFHTTHSDGRYSPERVQKELTRSGVGFAALTDHDRTSEDFATSLTQGGISSIPGAEISTHYISGNQKIGVHMTAYAPGFDTAVSDMLARTRAGKTEKVRQQVAKLIQAGYPLSQEGFAAWTLAKGYSPQVNNSHLASYVYSIEAAAKMANRDQIRTHNPNRVGFIDECLSRTGRNPIGAVEIPEYEPTTQEAAARVKKTGGIASIAHPNFTWGRYGGVERLKQDIAMLVEGGIEGIEINALASPEWVKVILDLKQRYGLLLTLGSDNHGEVKPSKTHGALGQMNPYFIEDPSRVDQCVRAMMGRAGV